MVAWRHYRAQCAACGVRRAACGVRRAACGVWCAVCGVDLGCVVVISWQHHSVLCAVCSGWCAAYPSAPRVFGLAHAMCWWVVVIFALHTHTHTHAGMLGTMATSYYRYEGSFTTPPCTQGVKWILSETSARASEAQVDAFVAAFDPNARPVQARNGRTVSKYSTI